MAEAALSRGAAAQRRQPACEPRMKRRGASSLLAATRGGVLSAARWRRGSAASERSSVSARLGSCRRRPYARCGIATPTSCATFSRRVDSAACRRSARTCHDSNGRALARSSGAAPGPIGDAFAAEPKFLAYWRAPTRAASWHRSVGTLRQSRPSAQRAAGRSCGRPRLATRRAPRRCRPPGAAPAAAQSRRERGAARVTRAPDGPS